MNKPKVLVVDDDQVDRIAVRRALRSAGADVDVEVHEAGSAADAERMLSGVAYDCVFLDHFLADGTGLDVLRRTRAAGVGAPIIVLTGQGDEETAVELMKAGALDYLPKAQATPERIAQSLRHALRVRHAEEQATLAARQRAEAVEQERRAREAAEAAQKRLAFLAEAGAIVSSSLEYEETLANVARLAVPSFADWCFVDLLEEDGSFTRNAVAHRDPAHAALAARLRRRYAPMPDAPHGVSRVMATGRSEVLTQTPDWVLVALARDAEHLEMLRELRPASVMTVPLVARGRTLGAMSFLTSGGARYTPEDLAFAEEIARRAAHAVDNARLYDAVRRAQEDIRRQLDLTSAITGSLAEGVCALDGAGRVIFANPAAERILDLRANDLLSRTLHDLMASPDAATRLLSRMLGGTIVRAEDDAFVRRDGTSVPVSFVASPIVTSGVVTGGVVAFHDATERKAAQAELEASRQQIAQTEKLTALGTLVSGVAHELRTPLTYLSNNLFLLRSRLDLAAREDARLEPLVRDVARFADAALEGVDRLNALVRDLRPFARTEPTPRVEAGLHEVVAVAVDLFRATHRGRVQVDADLQPAGAVLVDKGQVQRVVLNLLLNAAEAMRGGGRVRVHTRSAGGEAVVEVEDEGPGIPPEIRSRIFDPFFTTKPEGTGLGLAISRRIVEAHGGGVSYVSEVGRGTTFVVRLPLAASSAAPARLPPVAPAAAGPTTT